MNTRQNQARLAGLLYLIIVVTGIINLMYVPSQLIVWDDASATNTNIVASETLFKLGILAAIICYTTFLFLPIVLYRLLHTVSKNSAIWMVVLALFSVPFSFSNILNKVNVLTLIDKTDYIAVYTQESLKAILIFITTGFKCSPFFGDYGSFPSVIWCLNQVFFQKFWAYF